MHGQEALLTQAMLPESFGRSDSAEPEPARAFSPPDEERNEHDLRQLRAALEVCDGNMSRAAAKVGISRQRAYRLMAGRNAPVAGDEAAADPDDEGAHGTRL